MYPIFVQWTLDIYLYFLHRYVECQRLRNMSTRKRRGGCTVVGVNLLKAVLVTCLHLEFDLWDEVLHRKASSKTIRFTSAHRSTK
jgi:hypothetical protein